MKHPLIAIASFCFLLVDSVCAYSYQDSLNLITRVDDYKMQQIEYRYVANDDSLWDFTNLDIIENEEVSFLHCSDSSAIEVTPYSLTTFSLTKDSLFLIKYETPLTHITYNEPICLQTTATEVGDSIISKFMGYGTYCRKYDIKADGICKTKFLRKGIFIIQDGDTLRNVLCLHRVTATNVEHKLLEDSLRDAHVYLEEKNEYEWYLPNTTYPFYRSIIMECRDNGRPTFRRCIAYRITNVNELIENNTDENTDLLNNSNDRSFDEKSLISLFNLQNENNIIKINIKTTEETKIYSRLCDAHGITFKNDMRLLHLNEPTQIIFNCMDLHKGTYIVYININGLVFSKNVNIR